MEIIKGTLNFKNDKKSIVTIGKFDGIHRGHLLILDKLWEYHNRGYKTIVITFDFAPMAVITGNKTEVLTTMEEKRLVMDAAGVDILIELPFNETTAAISAEDFIKEILVDKLSMSRIVVGEDCTFGHKALGNVELLEKFSSVYNYKTDVIKKLTYNGRVISSSYIRELVSAGNIEDAKAMSRQPYFVLGNPQKLGGLGQKFGYPYCVFDVSEDKVIPPSGLYYTKVMLEDVFYPALSYVSEDNRTIETYLFEATRKMGYDNISVGFFKFVRKPILEDGTLDDHQRMREMFKPEIVGAINWHRENTYIPEDVCLRQ